MSSAAVHNQDLLEMDCLVYLVATRSQSPLHMAGPVGSGQPTTHVSNV